MKIKTWRRQIEGSQTEVVNLEGNVNGEVVQEQTDNTNPEEHIAQPEDNVEGTTEAHIDDALYRLSAILILDVFMEIIVVGSLCWRSI